MSEYIEVESELSDDGTTIHIYTNLRLSDEEEESYSSAAEMEEGSPIAQALAVVPGLDSLHITGRDMVVTLQPEAAWHVIVNDVTAVIKDFFL